MRKSRQCHNWLDTERGATNACQTSRSRFFSLSSKQHLHPSQSCWKRMGPRGTQDHLYRALSTFHKLLPASTVLSKVQPTRVVLDRFRQTVCISSEFGNFPSNHVFPPVNFEPVVHSGNMTCSTEQTFSDGSQHVHVAHLDPPMTSSVPESPPLVQFHPRRLLHTNNVRHHPRTPTCNFVSLGLDRRPDTRTQKETCHIVVFTIFKRNILGSHEDFRTGLHFARHLLA